MKKFFSVLTPLIFLVACSSGTKKSPDISLVESKSPERKPAMHQYGGYDCVTGNLKLVYDGPGSNYAVGGYSHLYLIQNGKQEKALAYQEVEGDSASMGEQINEEELEVVFSQLSSTRLSRQKISPRAGDRCEPNEYSYSQSSWREKIIFKFDEVSQRVATEMGVKSGEVKTFTCSMTSATPIMCPSSGRYQKGDIAN